MVVHLEGKERIFRTKLSIKRTFGLLFMGHCLSGVPLGRTLMRGFGSLVGMRAIDVLRFLCFYVVCFCLVHFPGEPFSLLFFLLTNPYY